MWAAPWAGTDEQVQAAEDLRQLLRRDVVHPVQGADRPVHGAVQVQPGGILTEEQGRRLQPGGFGLGLHEHLGGGIHGYHVIAPAGKLAAECAGAAAQVQQKPELAPLTPELALIKVRKLAVGHVAGETVIPGGQKAVAAHLSCSFMRSKTME